MKTIYLTFAILFVSFNIHAQIPIINTIDVNGIATRMDSPTGTYLKDINFTFEPFLGVWKYQNGNEILIIKLEKVEQYLDPEFSTYYDFIKGNYSYSNDGGNTFVVNTIQQNIGNNNPEINPLYSGGPNNPTKDIYAFRDVIYQKNAWANFTFQNNNYQQLHLKLENKSGGFIYPATPPNPAFCIPNNVVLIKQ